MFYFVEIVDSGRDTNQASGRKVFFATIKIKDDSDPNYESCHTLYAYDTAPTNAQRNAIIAKFITNMNAAVDTDPYDDLKDDLRDLVHDAMKLTGKSKLQVKQAIINALS